MSFQANSFANKMAVPCCPMPHTPERKQLFGAPLSSCHSLFGGQGFLRRELPTSGLHGARPRQLNCRYFSQHLQVSLVQWEDVGPNSPQPTQVAASVSNVSPWRRTLRAQRPLHTSCVGFRNPPSLPALGACFGKWWVSLLQSPLLHPSIGSNGPRVLISIRGFEKVLWLLFQKL